MRICPYGALAALLLSGGLALSQDAPVQVIAAGDQEGAKINGWFAAGEAAGLGAIIYENRDGGHSQINKSHYPQLRWWEHSAEEKAGGLDRGSARVVRPGAVIGNASMASNVDQTGCIPRMYTAFPQGFPFLVAQYSSNNLFVYPEHRDHDPGVNGRGGYGDVLPFNSPYMVISQGSSGSDRAFLNALLRTTASFSPTVQDHILRARLLAPTLQQIMRRSYGADPAEAGAYFLPETHPTVFDSKLLDGGRMVDLAHAMAVEDIPPLARIEVLAEEFAQNGRDFFEPPEFRSETLGQDTPGLAARVYRSSKAVRRYRLGAGKSADPMGRPLTFRWEVVRGDPAKVQIKPMADGTSAEVQIAHHNRFHAPGGEITTNRIDIALFASNGRSWSAPAFFTLYCIPGEVRTYDQDGRLLEIDYWSRNHQPEVRPLEAKTVGSLLNHFVGGEAGSVSSFILREAVPAEHHAALGGIRGEIAAHLIRAEELDAEAKARAAAAQAVVVEAVNHLRAVRAKPETQRAPGELEAATAAKAEADAANAVAKVEIAEIGAARAAEEEKVMAVASRDLGSGQSAKSILRAAFDAMLADAGLYQRHSRAIDALGNREVAAARGELMGLGVLSATEGGGVHFDNRGAGPMTDPTQLPPNDIHHLRVLNSVILRHALYPGTIASGGERNWSSRFVSLPKRWRDIFLYDQAGAPWGWVRVEGGKVTAYTAEGELIVQRRANGSPSMTTPVSYRRDQSGQRLIVVPQ